MTVHKKSERERELEVHLLIDVDDELLREVFGEVGMETSVDPLDHPNNLTHLLAVELYRHYIKGQRTFSALQIK